MCPELGTLVLDTLNPDRVELISAVGTFNLKINNWSFHYSSIPQ